MCKGDVGRLTVGGGGGAWFGGRRSLVPVPVPEAQLPVPAQPLVLAQVPRRRCCCACGLAGPGGGRVGGAAAPAQPPVVLSRNGKEFTVTGATNVRAGTEIKVTTERPTLSLTLTELDAGSWVIFELPGFTTAASGTAQNSLDALRKASDTSYYKGKDALWVKVVSNGDVLGSGRRPWWRNQPPGQPVSSNPAARARAPGCARGLFYFGALPDRPRRSHSDCTTRVEIKLTVIAHPTQREHL